MSDRERLSVAMKLFAAGSVSTAVLLAGLIVPAVVVIQKPKEYPWFG